MSQNNFNNDFYAPTDLFAAAADADARSTFIAKTYGYLTGAILALIGLEFVYFQLFGMDQLMGLATLMMGTRISWLVVLGLFMVVSGIANSMALNLTKPGVQIAGLVVYVVAQSVILLPLLTIAMAIQGPEQGMQTILSAGLATGGLFVLMSLVVFMTRADFSFLRSILWFGSLAAIGLIVVGALFQFNLGPIFIYAMIALMCGYILYFTSNVLHQYRIGQHVAAALALFASVATLFWYVLQLFLSSRD